MRSKIVEEYTRKERKSLIMKEVIKSLTNLDGIASHKDMKRDIYDNSTLKPEDYIDYTRQSKQTGNKYKSFNYHFNFAIKYLLSADFVRYPKRGEVELTEKRRKVNFENFDPLKEVRVISELSIEKVTKRRETEKELLQVEVEEEADLEDLEDVWRRQLNEAL